MTKKCEICGKKCDPSAVAHYYGEKQICQDCFRRQITAFELVRHFAQMGVNERLEFIGCTSCKNVKIDLAEDGTFTIDAVGGCDAEVNEK
jgi:hypothetical protein